MSDFAGMEDLLQDFLIEAGDLLSGVDNKLVDLERAPGDRGLLNEIFRGFHTIKGGAGFLNATELVTLCHLTENLFDKLRNGELELQPEVMDVIMEATATVRTMFGSLEQAAQPPAADDSLIGRLKSAIAGELVGGAAGAAAAAPAATASPAKAAGEPDWELLHHVAAGLPVPTKVIEQVEPKAPPQAAPVVARKSAEQVITDALGRRATDRPGASGPTGRRELERQRDTSIRVDTARLDQVLNLSGEIGLTKNRLNALRSEILSGRNDSETLHALDLAVSQLDLLVSDLQNAVMKTRMQPIGRLFQKYPRIARDLARNLGKDVELVLKGEDTEIDKTMIEDLGDPIIHLIRNAVDHGVEDPAERLACGKPAKSEVRLEAQQEGDHIVITVADDGRGMNAERLRAKAVERGLITDEEANSMDERQSYNLVFLPGFSMAAQISDVSGRGVGMDVVRTNIQKLNGSIDIRSQPNKGTTFVISLPLTLAILPVLLVRLGEQPFAVPLSMVREILPISADAIQEVGGRATMVIRGEVLPVLPLAGLLGWPLERTPQYGVLMQAAELSFILAVDTFAGREDAVIKSLDDFRPKGVAGVTTLANGQIVLILDMKELLGNAGEQRGVTRRALIRNEAAALTA
ncbi:MAG TPA: chemotaxis protein CheA [Rhodocyclaceae bacterium]|nr:chemotaxis protein CheA [Rhodocyclaceae bacterium]